MELAGSEKIKLSATLSNADLREAQSINKSLCALGDVMSALSVGHKHVPYRSSKLTFLLQNILKENCKLLMIINIAPIPTQDYAEESMQSLLFAQRCKTVHLGREKKKEITK